METTQNKTIDEILEIEAKAKTTHGENNFQFIWESQRNEDGDKGAVLTVDQA